MTQKLRALLMGALLLGTASAAHAQLFAGVGVYGHQYKDLGFFPGIQARVGVEANEGRYTANIGFNYSPTQVSRSVSLMYSNSSNNAKQLVTHQQRVSVYGLTFHGAINLGNDDQNFRIGLLAGISVDEYAVKYEKGTIPSGYRYAKESDLEDGSPALWNTDIGIKGNYRLGNGAIYTEILMGIPIMNVNSNLILAGASTHYGIQLGYKFNLNSTSYAYRSRF